MPEIMNRKLFCILLFFGALTNRVNAQTGRIDSAAVYILDRMSLLIGDLNTCSFTVNTAYDIYSDELGLVKHTTEEKVYLTGPDKFMIAADGDKGHRAFWYDGKNLSYYSYDNNRYAQITAPPTIIETIDSVSRTYGVEFPAADFFYPTFVDDLLESSTHLVYLGMTSINGKPCFHIAGRSALMSFQFWISNDEFLLPLMMAIVYTGEPGTPQFQACYSDWKLNEEIPPSLFQFTPPPGAEKIKLAQKKNNP